MKNIIIGLFSIYLGSCIHPIHNSGSEENEKKEEILKSHLSLVQNYLDQNLPAEALDMISRLTELQKKDPRTRSLEALSHLALSNQQKAKIILEKVYEEEKSCFTALNYSSILLLEYKTDHAIKILDQCLSAELDYEKKERIYHNLAIAYEQKKEFDLAVKAYNHSLYEKPTYYPSIYRKGLLLLLLGKKKEAISAFEKAVIFCPNCISPSEKLFSLYQQMGDKGKAKKIIKKFLKNESISQSDRLKALNLLKKRY